MTADDKLIIVQYLEAEVEYFGSVRDTAVTIFEEQSETAEQFCITVTAQDEADDHFIIAVDYGTLPRHTGLHRRCQQILGERGSLVFDDLLEYRSNPEQLRERKESLRSGFRAAAIPNTPDHTHKQVASLLDDIANAILAEAEQSREHRKAGNNIPLEPRLREIKDLLDRS